MRVAVWLGSIATPARKLSGTADSRDVWRNEEGGRCVRVRGPDSKFTHGFEWTSGQLVDAGEEGANRRG